MARYAITVSPLTVKDAFAFVEATDIDKALEAAVSEYGLTKLSPSNAATHENHKPSVRRFTDREERNLRIQPADKPKAATKDDLTREVTVRDAAIAVLAKRLKLGPESVAKLLADCAKAIP